MQAFLDDQGISAYNTRLLKSANGEYEVRTACSKPGEPKVFTSDALDSGWKKITITYGWKFSEQRECPCNVH